MRSPSGQVRQCLFDASHVDARQLGTVDRLRARLELTDHLQLVAGGIVFDGREQHEVLRRRLQVAASIIATISAAGTTSSIRQPLVSATSMN